MVDIVTENFQNTTQMLAYFYRRFTVVIRVEVFLIQLGNRLWSSKNSSVGYGLAWENVVRFLAGSRNSFGLQSFQTKPFVKWSVWALFLGVKKQRRECNHWSPCIAEFEKVWMFTSTPPPCFISFAGTHLLYFQSVLIWRTTGIWRHAGVCGTVCLVLNSYGVCMV